MMQVWEHFNESQSQCETKFAQFGSQTVEIHENTTKKKKKSNLIVKYLALDIHS